MKKRIMLIAAGVLLLACLIPIPGHLKDGGTVEYRAILYTVSKVHRLADDCEAKKPYQEGTVIELLGIELYNSVK